MRLIVVIGLLVLKITSIKSQELRPYTPDSSLSQISVYQWTGDNGLVSNNITSSFQASSGFIWITTYNGIMSFDGANVDIYDRSNIDFLSTDAFYKVYQSKTDIVYFC